MNIYVILLYLFIQILSINQVKKMYENGYK